MTVFCGIDWAERHHDIALVGQAGTLVARRRISDTPEGYAELAEIIAAAGDTADDPIPVALETPRGLLVAALRAAGRPVYAINPLAVARYRDRHTASRGKSDQADAFVLANILRTDAHVHRLLPADTPLAQAIAVLARAHQDATWRRSKALQELRALLREYYPGFLTAFGTNTTNLASADARAVLALAPTPAAAASLRHSQIAAALRRAGRQRRVDATATRIHLALRHPQLRQHAVVEQAMGIQALALLAALNTACTNVDDLAEATMNAFRQHPDHQIITSFPGLADVTGARVLAEIGDSRQRFADARALKAYAGSAPITRASGRTTTVTRRRIKNNRLAATGFIWAFMAITNSPSARAHYDHRKATGDRHAAALRSLAREPAEDQAQGPADQPVGPAGHRPAELRLVPELDQDSDKDQGVADDDVMPSGVSNCDREPALTTSRTSGPGQEDRSAGQEATSLPTADELEGSNPDETDVAAVAAYRASLDSGVPLSERKLAAMFGKTSRRWARNRMAEARCTPASAVTDLA